MMRRHFTFSKESAEVCWRLTIEAGGSVGATAVAGAWVTGFVDISMSNETSARE